MRKLYRYLYLILFIVIPLLVFVLSRNAYFASLNFIITLFLIMACMAFVAIRHHKAYTPQRMGILLLVTILYLVASTGWFFSPFFFTLYLTSIGLAFFFSQGASVAFTLTLVALFSLNIGEVDVTYDFLVLLSLLSVLPLSHFIRTYFIKMKEASKDILVLKGREDTDYDSHVKELLANKLNNFSANLREDINDIKQLAYAARTLKTSEDREKNNERIRTSAEKALRLLNDFEQETTGTTVKKNK